MKRKSERLVLGKSERLLKNNNNNNEYGIKTMTNVSVVLVWFHSQYAKQYMTACVHR